MKKSFLNVSVRVAALVAALVVGGAAQADEAAVPPPCKNHYILRPMCQAVESIEWLPAAAPLLSHGSGSSATLLDDGRVLLAGGDGHPDGAEIYDPASGRWSLAAPMQVTRAKHAAVRLRDGRVLVVGGATLEGNVAASAETYDPATDTWTSTAPLNFHRHLYLRGDLTANLLPDGKVLVTGGNDSDWIARAETELFDPESGTWTLSGRMTEGRLGHTATTLADGNVLVVGGVADWDFMFYRLSAELYDSALGQWRTLGSEAAVANHTATRLDDGRVVIAGGRAHAPFIAWGAPGSPSWPGASSSRSHDYDSISDEWVETESLSAPRHGHVAIAFPGGILLVGGRVDKMSFHYQTDVVTRADRYDAGAQKWTTLEEIGVPPDQPENAVPIAEGLVLFVGPRGANLLRY